MPASSVRPRNSRGMAIGTPCARMRTKRNNAVKLARTLTPVATLVPWSNAMRAHRWFDANALATPKRMTTPIPGANFACMTRKVIGCLLAALALPALACEMPDEGNMPMRRARVSVEYLVRLDAPVYRAGKCYWPVEVQADGKLWRRFLVTPDGKSV